MRIVMFYHSLLSCWNHGNAHFLRGIASELILRGHEVRIYEPRQGWSLRHLVAEHGIAPVAGFLAAYPLLRSIRYDLHTLDLEEVLDGTDLVLVHEWNDPELVRRVGEHRARVRSYRLLFHDTHHRAVTDEAAMAGYDLRDYDGVLAFGRVIRDLYLDRDWTAKAWTWHEAADVRVFRPLPDADRAGELIWIGNWGDDERSAELAEYLLDPVRHLELRAQIYGVRYPPAAVEAIRAAGASYRGWLPNFEVPRAFSHFGVTVHVPRRIYAGRLTGIPTIRPFEAMACGVPLVSAPWIDSERLFEPGRDFLLARDGTEMQRHLRAVLADPALARHLADNGRRCILERHTCGHRVDELMAVYRELRDGSSYLAGDPAGRGATSEEPWTSLSSHRV